MNIADDIKISISEDEPNVQPNGRRTGRAAFISSTRAAFKAAQSLDPSLSNTSSGRSSEHTDWHALTDHFEQVIAGYTSEPWTSAGVHGVTFRRAAVNGNRRARGGLRVVFF